MDAGQFYIAGLHGHFNRGRLSIKAFFHFKNFNCL